MSTNFDDPLRGLERLSTSIWFAASMELEFYFHSAGYFIHYRRNVIISLPLQDVNLFEFELELIKVY